MTVYTLFSHYILFHGDSLRPRNNSSIKKTELSESKKTTTKIPIVKITFPLTP